VQIWIFLSHLIQKEVSEQFEPLEQFERGSE